MTTKDLGMVTAYAYAVMGGYEGTEAEFEALLGNIATDLEEIENLTVIANTLPEGSSATASYADGVLTLGIPKGDTGATGAGATATVGTTTTGDPGTNASVTNSGTTKDAVFNFTIPRGDTGNGIESIYLTGTSGAVKTYTILFTDGNTTTFDVTDGEVTNASLAEVLEDYAKTDGAYESMTVGNAEQLISSVTVNDKVPYNFRTSGGSIDIGNREVDKLVGGTVAWNQLMSKNSAIATYTKMGLTLTREQDTPTWNVTGTYESGNGDKNFYLYSGTPISFIKNHVYLFNNTSKYFKMYLYGGFTIPRIDYCSIGKLTGDGNGNFCFNTNHLAADTVINETFSLNIFDLTQMFGSTIADYIYSLETANAGAGVAFFRKLFPKPYYAYNAGELKSVSGLVSHDMTGFNQWDEEWEVGGINETTGQNETASDRIRSKNYIPVVPSTTYYIKSSATIVCCRYDADKNYLGYNNRVNETLVLDANTHYLRFRTATAYGTTYKNDICINLSWDGERDGEYEPYVKHEYALDSDLELRGIPKLDSANNLYYDGDTYESDGSVSRKYGIVDLGTLTWEKHPSMDNIFFTQAAGTTTFDTMMKTAGVFLNTKYPYGGTYSSYNAFADKVAYSSTSFGRVGVKDTAYSTAEEFKTAMSGVYLVYELATPTTEEADPYQNPQIVDDFGTEEYVDERTVAIPVGHDTEYMNNLKAKLEMAPDSPDGDGDYIVRQTNGENSYVPLMKELPSAPSEDGTYTLKCTVASGVATLGWEREE